MCTGEGKNYEILCQLNSKLGQRRVASTGEFLVGQLVSTAHFVGRDSSTIFIDRDFLSHIGEY